MSIDEVRVTKIREGRRTPMEERQERYDTFRKWSEEEHLSLAQIRDRWLAETGKSVARQRVASILSAPRPGTFYKGSPLVSLERQRDTLRTRIRSWKRRKSPVSVTRVSALEQELASVQSKLREERRQAKKLSRVTA